jgi:hypothetical protein
MPAALTLFVSKPPNRREKELRPKPSRKALNSLLVSDTAGRSSGRASASYSTTQIPAADVRVSWSKALQVVRRNDYSLFILFLFRCPNRFLLCSVW